MILNLGKGMTRKEDYRLSILHAHCHKFSELQYLNLIIYAKNDTICYGRNNVSNKRIV